MLVVVIFLLMSMCTAIGILLIRNFIVLYDYGLICFMSASVLLVLFFFFKQKTAYEMRISDWSSDVCSSDLPENWVLSAELSRACNKRLFRQKRDQFLIGVVEGRTYGAAVGGHGSLVDRARMAEDQVIYLFHGQGTTDSRVYHSMR